MKALQAREGVAALALEFLILTCGRTGEVIGSTWAEIDLERVIWTVPAARMKKEREHRVPFSGAALAIVKALHEVRVSRYVFPGQRRDKPLSSASMEAVLERMDMQQHMTVHGFRSSFRDWCGNETSFPRSLAEASLAHVVGNQTELAYRRSDALERRHRRVLAEIGHPTFQTERLNGNATKPNNAQWRCARTGHRNPPVKDGSEQMRKRFRATRKFT
jgi:integrase